VKLFNLVNENENGTNVCFDLEKVTHVSYSNGLLSVFFMSGNVWQLKDPKAKTVYAEIINIYEKISEVSP